MGPLDAAYEAFKAFARDHAAELNSPTTEADTRLRVIDRILIEVLGWPRDDLSLEEATGTGFADYICRAQDKARLIVEAKRDGRSLGCEGKAPATAFKLSGPAFRTEAAKEGIRQAIGYCGSKNAELACVTNGREWIIFRGNRIGDGTDTLNGMALVFSNLVDIDDQFEKFYNLLSREAVKQYNFRPYFQEAEGQPIRTSIFSKSYRRAGTARFLAGSELAADIDRMMGAFFQRLTGDDDPDLIRECFVETAESRHADKQLARIAEEIVGQLRPLETGEGTALRAVIERLQSARRREFVLVVGTKGSGKSTFMKRFFDHTLPRYIAERCTVARVDLRNSNGDEASLTSWLDVQLVEATERALFADAPGFRDLEGMFFDEYTRLRKGPWAVMYEKDRDTFQQDFGQLIESMRSERPGEYIKGLIRHALNSRHSLPVFVFDNADHFDIEFQQRVYQYARSVYEGSNCLVLVPITDRTSWQLSKHGALQSFEHEALFLPTPPTGDVIRKRIQYIEARVGSERLKPDQNYFVQRGVTLSLEDIEGFTRTLQRVFLETQGTAKTIGELANHDVRRTLTLIRQSMASPHLAVADLITSYVAGSAENIPTSKINRAIIRQHYDIYPVGQHDFVQNIFALDASLTTSPLLGMRLLQLLSDVPEKEHEGPTIDLDQVIAYATGMGIESRAAELWLDVMLKTGLILNYDPTIDQIEAASRIEISPAGRRHLRWSSGVYEYVGAMADVTPLLSEAVLEEMYSAKSWDWRTRTGLFLDYVLHEDGLYCAIPDHPTYDSQRRIPRLLRNAAERLSPKGG